MKIKILLKKCKLHKLTQKVRAFKLINNQWGENQKYCKNKNNTHKPSKKRVSSDFQM